MEMYPVAASAPTAYADGFFASGKGVKKCPRSQFQLRPNPPPQLIPRRDDAVTRSPRHDNEKIGSFNTLWISTCS